jgi:hypothetical protein
VTLSFPFAKPVDLKFKVNVAGTGAAPQRVAVQLERGEVQLAFVAAPAGDGWWAARVSDVGAVFTPGPVKVTIQVVLNQKLFTPFSGEGTVLQPELEPTAAAVPAEPPAEPQAKPSAEPQVEPAAEPPAELAVAPAAEAAAAPAAAPTAAQPAVPAAPPVSELAAQPAAEQVEPPAAPTSPKPASPQRAAKKQRGSLLASAARLAEPARALLPALTPGAIEPNPAVLEAAKARLEAAKARLAKQPFAGVPTAPAAQAPKLTEAAGANAPFRLRKTRVVTR